ncbi:MAG: 2-oxopent-4-enoate hydratase [Myxococcales bacterium]|nr:2-oxopent-4-enoate hydratase [Myxococcales bacterium]
MIDVKAHGDALFEALRTRTPISPLKARFPSLDIETAYAIQRRFIDRRLGLGERIIGKKIGVTSLAVQRFLDVHQPDFGVLTDAMHLEDGAVIPASRTLIAPKCEGEVAFRLAADLRGPGITADDVLGAIDYAVPCFEIVDSRIRDWKIRIEDTIADNASCGVFVTSKTRLSAHDIDWVHTPLTVSKNGAPLSSGTGEFALGSPLICVAWLANTLGALGVPLLKGELILSGSLVALEPALPGDSFQLSFAGAECRVSFD